MKRLITLISILTLALVAPAQGDNRPVVGQIRLDAHLGHYSQNTHNPLKVTYFYSAAAVDTFQNNRAIPLPRGVLQLSSDGKVKCSIKVGGKASRGKCSVSYATPGKHKVVITFISGTTTVREIKTENI